MATIEDFNYNLKFNKDIVAEKIVINELFNIKYDLSHLLPKYRIEINKLIEHIKLQQDDTYTKVTNDQFINKWIKNPETLLQAIAISSSAYTEWTLSDNSNKVLDKVLEENINISKPILSSFFNSYNTIKKQERYFIATKKTNNKDLVIVFRGTKDSKDIIDDLNCSFNNYHTGMLCNAITYAFEDDEYMWKQIINAQTVTTYGHSLGAGISFYLCILAHKYNLEHKFTSYCISCPPVFPKNFKNKLAKQLCPINDINDPITTLPIIGDIGQPLFIISIDAKKYSNQTGLATHKLKCIYNTIVSMIHVSHDFKVLSTS